MERGGLAFFGRFIAIIIAVEFGATTLENGGDGGGAVATLRFPLA